MVETLLYDNVRNIENYCYVFTINDTQYIYYGVLENIIYELCKNKILDNIILHHLLHLHNGDFVIINIMDSYVYTNLVKEAYYLGFIDSINGNTFSELLIKCTNNNIFSKVQLYNWFMQNIYGAKIQKINLEYNNFDKIN